MLIDDDDDDFVIEIVAPTTRKTTPRSSQAQSASHLKDPQRGKLLKPTPFNEITISAASKSSGQGVKSKTSVSSGNTEKALFNGPTPMFSKESEPFQRDQDENTKKSVKKVAKPPIHQSKSPILIDVDSHVLTFNDGKLEENYADFETRIRRHIHLSLDNSSDHLVKLSILPDSTTDQPLCTVPDKCCKTNSERSLLFIEEKKVVKHSSPETAEEKRNSTKIVNLLNDSADFNENFISSSFDNKKEAHVLKSEKHLVSLRGLNVDQTSAKRNAHAIVIEPSFDSNLKSSDSSIITKASTISDVLFSFMSDLLGRCLIRCIGRIFRNDENC